MKLVCLDGYCENPGDMSWAPVADQVDEFIVYDRTEKTAAAAIERIGDADIVLTNKTPLSKEVFDACPNIKLVCCISTGYAVVDIAYAKSKGIPVCNVPIYGVASVSQFTIALLLEACHHIGYHSDTVHAGKWENCIDFCYADYPQIELEGLTMGIIGLGNIGRHTAAIAGALGMKVIAYDEWQNEKGKALATYVDLDTLLAESDVITIHMPLLPSNTNLFRKETFDKMKDGVIFINASRGKMVNEPDLKEALESGKVKYACLDVVSTEPIKADNVLKGVKNCIITPHMAWLGDGSRRRILNTTADNVKAFLAGEPQNVVNK